MLAGKSLFFEAGCNSCHTESYTTVDDPELPFLSNQRIFPYTDLLLHDMGEDLADIARGGEPADANALVEFRATSREWRTPPLWGLGMVNAVNPDAAFLHDGRARTVMEAVLWHGGEAEASKQAVLQFTAAQRIQFEAFLLDL